LALYDLTSKVTGVRVVDLLGGQLHDRFRTVYSLRLKDPKDMAVEARSHVGDGIRGFEMHVGTNVHDDIARVREVREAVGPDVSLICDANGHWTPKEAIRVLRELEDFGITVAEQPTLGLEGLATVRSQVSTEITADEDCPGIADVVNISRYRAADAVCIKVVKAGGLYPAKRMAIVAQALGLGVRIDGVGAGGETRLSTTAAACLVANLPRVIGAGVMQHRHLKEDFVLGGGLTLEDGHVLPPAGLGLVESVDESLLTLLEVVE
jgi:L-alanine-DL-glutamate epimerase-like enolase superfamily enzyme